MSKLDLAKEKIAYLKLWLTIVAAVCVTLTGWLLSNFLSAHWHLVAAGILALLVIGYCWLCNPHSDRRQNYTYRGVMR
uniref:Uncharacterized protein n=1 Tax=Candidatus Kentrum sp. SD TaxID=2126332 RepID=A0A450YCR6_9GAMM|nr:MAG: hypothetical protein BECKSD772F_GA0070984_103626 [Candidatus Kentron sp. SD]VFK44056.1 MAG: hypothetical protein BECKSD772E_GA0070983_103228 [Candidatus Kentron sp. SD]